MNNIRIQSKVIGSLKNPSCKFTCLQVLQLFVLFPFFSVKNSASYSSSALDKMFACKKDIFYRFMNDGNVNWYRIIYSVFRQLHSRISRTKTSKDGVRCVIIDDKADLGALKQLKVIKDVFCQSDKIIVATDAGREGELIFRYIYQYIGCNKPFVRLWISSLTDKAIREGLQNLKDGSLYDNLFLSAQARSEADYLIGINGTQALSVAAGQGIFSLGRVQSPTLAMICTRFLENKNFVPQKYWQLKLQATKDNVAFTALSTEKYDKQQPAIDMLQRIKEADTVQVKAIERKEVNQEPPLLYDLTTLQKEANTKLNFSADKTLSIAQKLYEGKLISYPRTGSRYISQDVFEEIPERSINLEQYARFAGYAVGMKGKTLNSRSVKDGKVTDHHALIVTENLLDKMEADE